MTKEILSAGIDIGTSTMQLIFSRLVLQDTEGFGRIPQVKVVSKEVIYESGIYFTPLSSWDEVDGQAVNQIIKQEYEKAGVRPEDLATGAVIITGESSRKKNARTVVQDLSEVTGDFVAAVAGADLESVLAGKGSGASDLSLKTGKTVVNLDIGGGTTNLCVFENGEVSDTACLDIGGRLVKIRDNRIEYVAPKVRWLAGQLGLSIEEGDAPDEEKLVRLTDAMAGILAESIGLVEKGPYRDYMVTNHPLQTKAQAAEIITFSGGVAQCLQQQQELFAYGDIGVLLARSIKKNAAFCRACVEPARETVRATVIGAGNYSMDISGSTIEYSKAESFPLKNIPVVKVLLEREEDIEKLRENIRRAVSIYTEDTRESTTYAIAMKGLPYPSFLQIQQIAEQIAGAWEDEAADSVKGIVIVEQDIAKALGQALHRRIRDRKEIICIDGICCSSGDYIDLLEPTAFGKVIPVVVKTLIFHNG